MNATELNAARVITDLKRIVRDSEALLFDSGEALGDGARQTRARLGRTVEAAKAACRRVEEKAIDRVQAADKVIHTHPYESMGIAAAVGLLIGLLMSRVQRK